MRLLLRGWRGLSCFFGVVVDRVGVVVLIVGFEIGIGIGTERKTSCKDGSSSLQSRLLLEQSVSVAAARLDFVAQGGCLVVNLDWVFVELCCGVARGSSLLLHFPWNLVDGEIALRLLFVAFVVVEIWFLIELLLVLGLVPWQLVLVLAGL